MGFKLDGHFASGDSLLQALSPVLDKLLEGDKAKFAIHQHQSFDVAFTTDEGFNYGLDQSKVFVSFKHRMKAKPVSGGPPIMEMMSEPAPFTKLLPKVCSKLIEAALLLPKTESRKVTRVGVISTTSVAEDDLPPGIARFIRYIGRPWSDQLDHFNISVAAILDNKDGWSDKCIHTLTKTDDPEELLTISFDWQRTFASGYRISRESLESIAEKATVSSSQYFEELAEGSRFDEEIISAT
jgi:hypothetical protein